MNVEYLKIDDVKPYKKNAKKHDQRQIDNVAESIRQFGFAQPLVIDKDGSLIIGHCRLEASKKLGIEEVPVVRMDQLTEEQVEKLRLLDNKLNESDWDIPLLKDEVESLDFSDFDIDWGFAVDEEDSESSGPEEDGFEPQPKAQPMIQEGDIILLGRHKLMCGDTTTDDIDKLMSGTDGAALLVTDPPRNVEPEIDFLAKSFKNMFQYIKQGAPFYIWYSPDHAANIFVAADKANVVTRQQLIWVKKSPDFSNQDYKLGHEECLYGWNGDEHYFVDDNSKQTVYGESINIDKMNKSELKSMLHELLNVHHSTVVTVDEAKGDSFNSSAKPIKLIGDHIKNSSKPGDIVLDAFGGSGSTLIACEQLDRTCCTMEINPSYAETVIDRYIKFTHQSDDVFILRGEETLTYDELKTLSKSEELDD